MRTVAAEGVISMERGSVETEDAGARDRMLHALDDISAAALQSRDLAEFLQRLLGVLLETSPAVDAAAILLREGDELRVRAAVGVELANAEPLRVGEGFAGTIAARREPMGLRSPSAETVRALYGVPLIEAERVVGIAYMGSLSAYDFSEQDRHLLAALARRATSAIVQHALREEAHERARQQAAIAELGQRALLLHEVQPLMDEAVLVASRTLGTELVQVMELVSDGSALVLCAGVGWNEGLVGTAEVSAGKGSHAGFTLLSHEPVIVDDLRAETRFSGSPLLVEHGAVSGMSVFIPAPGPERRPYGIFGVHSRRRRSFTRDDINFLQAVANVIAAGLARHRAEQEVRESATRFKALAEDERAAHAEAEAARERVTKILESIIDGFIAFDPDWRFVYINAEARRILQALLPQDAGQLIGRVLWEEMPALRGSKFERAYRRAMEVRVPVEIEDFLPALNAWLEVRAFPSEEGISIYFRDVTERRRAGDAVRFLAEASRVLAESLEYQTTLRKIAALAVPRVADWCAIDLLTEDGGLARVGTTHKDPARMPFAQQLEEKYPPRLDAPTGPANVIRTGQPEIASALAESTVNALAVDEEHRRLLQTLGVSSYICMPMTARGRVLGTLTLVAETGRTFSEWDVRLAEELARRAAISIDNTRLYADAQRAVRVREDILRVVSHDLRNPLGAIQMSAAMQMKIAPPDERGRRIRKQAETIQRSAERMSRLIDDLSDVGHIEAGTLAIERAPEDPAAMIREIVESFEAAAQQHGTSLRQESPGELPFVDCDRHRVQQVLSNLVANAVKVTAGGSITVRAEAKPKEIGFAVADTGPGIAAEDLPHVFKRYWRGETAPYKGTGLGLWIAKGIVEAHGGRIWAESTPRVGSTFHFTLPR